MIRDSASPARTFGRRGYRDPLRQRDDFYRTPACATEALLRVERFQNYRSPGEDSAIWECACGDGAISEVLKQHSLSVVSTDLFDRGYGHPRVDFLMEWKLRAPLIVTNPPFKLADAFALHAMELGADKIAIFQKTTWLAGAARHASLWRVHPPIRVWQFSKRLTLWRGDETGHATGGMIDFAWFVWERGFCGAPTLGWLP